MQKTVYQTDANDIYIYPTPANELTLAPSHFNVPFGAYEEVPPEAPPGMLVIRVAGAWALAEDHRRASLWLVSTGAPYVIGSEVALEGETFSYAGAGSIPQWLTATAPVALPTQTIDVQP
ncbi:phage tail protein [Achromobacter xylosoxidans]|uniref:phage tail protein n=1 Tax=Alcaligenes xylosoxydans xylosoxydans TaxID=85698 RepID=UPI000B48AAA0|nr:phage tail protein [Achromobacter xylosoxidans]